MKTETLTHTPGPWTYDGTGLILGSPRKKNGLRPSVGVADSPDDARLIAAAPDLLEELDACALAIRLTTISPITRQSKGTTASNTLKRFRVKWSHASAMKTGG